MRSTIPPKKELGVVRKEGVGTSVAQLVRSVSYTHLTLPTIYSV